MDNKNDILLKVLSIDQYGQIDKKYADAISLYRESIELIEKTYFALGRKRELKYTTQSTTNGQIDTRAISPTSKI